MDPSAHVTRVSRVIGWACVGIGALQMAAGAAAEPGLEREATVDSHVRFMGSVFVGYGMSWLAGSPAHGGADVPRLRALAGLMALGGTGRLLTRATIGRPHRFHDLLLATELSAPLVLEAARRADARVR